MRTLRGQKAKYECSGTELIGEIVSEPYSVAYDGGAYRGSLVLVHILEGVRKNSLIPLDVDYLTILPEGDDNV